MIDIVRDAIAVHASKALVDFMKVAKETVVGVPDMAVGVRCQGHYPFACTIRVFTDARSASREIRIALGLDEGEELVTRIWEVTSEAFQEVIKHYKLVVRIPGLKKGA